MADENSSFLCLRRGVSKCAREELRREDFSLPTQRCFPRPPHRRRSIRLFSAYAEVFLSLSIILSRFRTFLCLRRGVSDTARDGYVDFDFSLPTQRCF